LSKIPKYKGMKIADFGCGEGKLHLELIKAGHPEENLFSFDAGKPEGSEFCHITQSDIANVPIPNNSVDVCVFCLSLMGTNFP
jgi:ribosomal RNA-processing protein 8